MTMKAKILDLSNEDKSDHYLFERSFLREDVIFDLDQESYMGSGLEIK